MDQSVYDIIKVYLAQMESAIKISETISKHSNREDVNGDDIICGLVYRLMRPMTKIEIDESLNKAETRLKPNIILYEKFPSNLKQIEIAHII